MPAATLYDVKPVEAIRKSLRMSPEKFSIEIGYSALGYRKALERGGITEQMAAMIERYAAEKGIALDPAKTFVRSRSGKW